MNLQSKIEKVPGIGPKTSKLLNKLGIKTVEDLIYYFPFRYEDLSDVVTIANAPVEEPVTIQAKLEEIDTFVTKYKKKITKGRISDETGKMEVVWFNQFYLKNTLDIGETYNFTGKVNSFNSKKSLVAPKIEKVSEHKKSLHSARIVPIYPETKGITSVWLRTRINQILGRIEKLEEYLPAETLTRNNLEEINFAIKQIHFPDSLEKEAKARQRFAFEELFLELLGVEARKRAWNDELKGIVFENKENEVENFVKSLPFSLTDSQKRAISEISKDMSKQHPMNRLLEGDVGTGKTIVAIAASYVAYLNGYKTLYMAPTEILANQHFETFVKFLGKFGPKIILKTGSKKASLEEDFDIAIGTHALIFAEDNIENLGLVIVDEQHRFGVEQRAKIMQMGKNNKIERKPNLLTMTATPIPRTLALTLYGDLQISVLDAPPNKDKKITTLVIPQSQREKAYKTIRAKNEPTFIVCPFIEQSESEMFENVKAAEAEYKTLSEGIFSDVTVGLLHGRMKPTEKEDVLKRFRSGEIKVLVSTPVIEVGVDIPDATIIVIESAERYGLASLHQLRGRVGRGQKEGFCFLMPSNYSKETYTRLKHLETESNGLKLAEIDLKTRGQGDIYGTEQSGFKNFKVADLSDVQLLEKAKQEAEIIFSKVSEFPNLCAKLSQQSNLIEKN